MGAMRVAEPLVSVIDRINAVEAVMLGR